ncbi:XVIPCD domain-containing protein [Xanthomonas euroxanthea]|uniref:XVIPCD domain-containing protein n=1 Tax=Xanthomonas euroxanthea TaxID=2259622 RepID=UPI001F2DEC6A|nr:XVIPCD domain-containing protein [Xanthomonas euroxanthea]
MPQETGQPARPQLSDNELKTLAYFAIGVASEGSMAGKNVAYQLSFAGSINDGVMTPIGNSGFSIGTLQTDLGQHPDVATGLVDAYQGWARQQTPAVALSEQQRTQTIHDLQRDGHAIKAENGRALDGTVKSNIDRFLASDAGVAFVHEHDRTQVEQLMRPGDGAKDLGSAVQQLRKTDLYADSGLNDQAKLATMIMKLENQAGRGRYPGVLQGINDGTLQSVDDVKTRIDGMLPNKIVKGHEQADYIESGVEHALKGTAVFNALREANQASPLSTAYGSVVADPLINPTDARNGHGAADVSHHYGVVKTLFLQNGEAPAFIQSVDQGASHAWGRPQAEGKSGPTAGLYSSGNDVVVWNRDGQGHAVIGGVWSDALRGSLNRERHQDGTTDINRVNSDGSHERLLHVDPHASPLRVRGEVGHPERHEAQPVGPTHGSLSPSQDPLHRQAEDAVRRLEQGLGREYDDNSARLAASSAYLAKENGLSRIDHVVLSENTKSVRQGENVFVVEGALNDPAHKMAHMKTNDAIAQPVEQSLAQLQALNETQRQQHSQQQEQQREQSIAPQHRMV